MLHDVTDRMSDRIKYANVCCSSGCRGLRFHYAVIAVRSVVYSYRLLTLRRGLLRDNGCEMIRQPCLFHWSERPVEDLENRNRFNCELSGN